MLVMRFDRLSQKKGVHHSEKDKKEPSSVNVLVADTSSTKQSSLLMELSVWAFLSLFLVVLFFIFSSGVSKKRVKPSSRTFIHPLVLVCENEKCHGRAMQLAKWPDSVRLAKTCSSEYGDRLTLAISPCLDLFPEWDKTARENSVNGDIVSHSIRRSLRALANPHPPLPLRLTPDEASLETPDVRLLLGSGDLVAAALSFVAENDSEAASACDIARWLKSCSMRLGKSDQEIAYEAGESLDR